MVEKYVAVIYFASTMIFTIGFGDMSATTTTSRSFFILLTFLNIIIYGYIMADLTSIFNEYFDQERTEEMKRE